MFHFPAIFVRTIFKIDAKHFEAKLSLFRHRDGSDRASFEDLFSLLSLLCLFGSLSRRTGAFFGQAKLVAKL